MGKASAAAFFIHAIEKDKARAALLEAFNAVYESVENGLRIVTRPAPKAFAEKAFSKGTCKLIPLSVQIDFGPEERGSWRPEGPVRTLRLHELTR